MHGHSLAKETERQTETETDTDTDTDKEMSDNMDISLLKIKVIPNFILKKTSIMSYAFGDVHCTLLWRYINLSIIIIIISDLSLSSQSLRKLDCTILKHSGGASVFAAGAKVRDASPLQPATPIPSALNRLVFRSTMFQNLVSPLLHNYRPDTTGS